MSRRFNKLPPSAKLIFSTVRAKGTINCRVPSIKGQLVSNKPKKISSKLIKKGGEK